MLRIFRKPVIGMGFDLFDGPVKVGEFTPVGLGFEGGIVMLILGFWIMIPILAVQVAIGLVTMTVDGFEALGKRDYKTAAFNLFAPGLLVSAVLGVVGFMVVLFLIQYFVLGW